MKTRKPRLRIQVYASAIALISLAACGGGGATSAPVPGAAPTNPPLLSSRRVMVMPVQGTVGVVGDLDAELAFALESRSRDVLWIPSTRVREAARMAPGMRIPLDTLPVEQFLQAEVRRIGDPLYGILRRAAAVTDAEVALIPVQVRARPDAPGTPGAVEVRVALIRVLTGDVLWFGAEEGRPGAGDDPAAIASAMETMARRLAPGG